MKGNPQVCLCKFSSFLTATQSGFSVNLGQTSVLLLDVFNNSRVSTALYWNSPNLPQYSRAFLLTNVKTPLNLAALDRLIGVTIGGRRSLA